MSIKMNVIRIIFASLLCVAVSGMPQGVSEVTRPDAAVSTINDASVSTTTARPPRNCTNARALPGACVQRMACDYGTTAIDLTLYAPRSYKSSCLSDEVCCPFDSLVPHETMSENQGNSEFPDDENF